MFSCWVRVLIRLRGWLIWAFTVYICPLTRFGWCGRNNTLRNNTSVSNITHKKNKHKKNFKAAVLYLVITMHPMLKQCSFFKVDYNSCWINVDTTLFPRCVPAGIIITFVRVELIYFFFCYRPYSGRIEVVIGIGNHRHKRSNPAET